MTALQDRVEERRRAVAIARHLRESGGAGARTSSSGPVARPANGSRERC